MDIIVGILMLLSGAALGWKATSEILLIKRCTVPIKGTFSGYKEVMRNGITSCIVSFKYVVGKNEIEHASVQTLPLWYIDGYMKIGTEMQIYKNPLDPKQYIVRNKIEGTTIPMGLFGVLFTVLGALGIAIGTGLV